MDPANICRKDRQLAEWQPKLCQAESEMMAKLAWGTRLGVRAEQVHKTEGKRKAGATLVDRKQMIWAGSLPSGMSAQSES